MKDSIMNDIRSLDFPLESIEYYKTESTNIMTIKNSIALEQWDINGMFTWPAVSTTSNMYSWLLCFSLVVNAE